MPIIYYLGFHRILSILSIDLQNITFSFFRLWISNAFCLVSIWITKMVQNGPVSDYFYIILHTILYQIDLVWLSAAEREITLFHFEKNCIKSPENGVFSNFKKITILWNNHLLHFLSSFPILGHVREPSAFPELNINFFKHWSISFSKISNLKKLTYRVT
jgi:hypothetical protein